MQKTQLIHVIIADVRGRVLSSRKLYVSCSDDGQDGLYFLTNDIEDLCAKYDWKERSDNEEERGT